MTLAILHFLILFHFVFSAVGSVGKKVRETDCRVFSCQVPRLTWSRSEEPSIALYYISLISGLAIYIDDRPTKTQMTIGDHLVGWATRGSLTPTLKIVSVQHLFCHHQNWISVSSQNLVLSLFFLQAKGGLEQQIIGEWKVPTQFGKQFSCFTYLALKC